MEVNIVYNKYNQKGKSEKNTRDVKMLINFKMKNFKSIKELQEFSLVAGTTKRMYERVLHKSKFGILKFSAIYGANASGKSNIVEALKYMKRIVVIGMPPNSIEAYYKLDSKTLKENTYFEVEIAIDDKYYAYGFEVNFYNNEIIDEWLIELKNEKNDIIFERSKNDIRIIKKFTNKIVKNKLSVYVDDIKGDKSILFLSYLNKNKSGFYQDEEVQVFKNIYSWFEENLDIADPNSIITSGDYILVQKKLDLIRDFLKLFDTGIIDIRKEETSFEEFKKRIPTLIINEITEDIKKNQEKYSEEKEISMLLRVENDFWIIKSDNGNILKYEKLCFYHDGNTINSLSLNQESDGTIRLLDLAEILLTDEKNKTYVIDELDRSLHPQVTCKFVELFLEKASDIDFSNQLIVTTHESRLLDFNILRRDEIWFVNKHAGETSLYSLEQFNERFDKKIDKAYLDGRYGGVPIFDTVFPPLNSGSKDENKQ